MVLYKRNKQDYYLRSRDGHTLFYIAEGINRIGRGEGLSDYFLDSMDVALQQAEFCVMGDGSLHIRRTGLNPVTVNGMPLPLDSSWYELCGCESIVVVGHQFDLITVPCGMKPEYLLITNACESRETVFEYEGYFTCTTSIIRYVMYDPNKGEEECEVINQLHPKKKRYAITGDTRFSLIFPGGDEPTIVPGLRGYFTDVETRDVLASAELFGIFNEPHEALLNCPDGDILINSYLNGTYDFYKGKEKIAHFRREYDAKRRYAAYGDNFDMNYYAWCVQSLSVRTRAVILSIPFMEYFGVSPHFRVEERQRSDALNNLMIPLPPLAE